MHEEISIHTYELSKVSVRVGILGPEDPSHRVHSEPVNVQSNRTQERDSDCGAKRKVRMNLAGHGSVFWLKRTKKSLMLKLKENIRKVAKT